MKEQLKERPFNDLIIQRILPHLFWRKICECKPELFSQTTCRTTRPYNKKIAIAIKTWPVTVLTLTGRTTPYGQTTDGRTSGFETVHIWPLRRANYKRY